MAADLLDNTVQIIDFTPPVPRTLDLDGYPTAEVGFKTDAEVGITDAEVFPKTDSEEDRRQSIGVYAKRTETLQRIYC